MKALLGFALCAALFGQGCAEPAPEAAPLVQFHGLDGGFEKAPVRREGTGLRGAAASSGLERAPTSTSSAVPGSEREPLPNDTEPAKTVPASTEIAPPSAPPGDLPTLPDLGGPSLAALKIASTIFKQPHINATRLGYVRLGGLVRRDESPVKGSGCKGDWYRVYPAGFMCTDEATTNLEDPLVRASQTRPDLSKPLPYRYAFVRATAPQYLRIPSFEQQKQSEFKLEEHLDWYRQNYAEVQRVTLGANDQPLDERGVARLGLKLPPGQSLSSQATSTELLGGRGENGEIPFWLAEGRLIPNVSGFEVPSYALFADRVRRKSGLSLVDAFVARDGDHARRFAVTVDLRLIPGTKLKPDTGSPFHGVELSRDFPLPAAFVTRRGATTWKLLKGVDEVKAAEALPLRALIPLTGNVRIKAGKRFYQLGRELQRWVEAADVSVFGPPPNFPKAAEEGKKWIDISLVQQTLVLYEGKQAVYATLVSTGRDRLGDPEKSLATPRGEFTIRSKHIAAAMDSEENSAVSGGTRSNTSNLPSNAAATRERLLLAEKEGEALNADDQRRLLNIKKGRDPEYGVTMRRGHSDFELRDVPWIQYFAAGYALHGAYWHDVFGSPRSHGCVNLAPIDARYVFQWTEPAVPMNWHGVNTDPELGTGTLVRVRE